MNMYNFPIIWHYERLIVSELLSFPLDKMLLINHNLKIVSVHEY